MGLCSFLWPNYGRSDASNSCLLQKDLCQHATAPRKVVVSAPDPAAGHCQPAPLQRLLDIHRQVWLSLFWGHCSFFLGPGAHKVLLCAPRVCFPGDSESFCQISRLGNMLWSLELWQQCENFFDINVLRCVGHLLGGSTGALMATSSKRTCATHHASQVCCSQSPCPRGRSLLTRASARDTQTLKGRSGSISRGGHCSFPSVLLCMRFCLSNSMKL